MLWPPNPAKDADALLAPCPFAQGAPWRAVVDRLSYAFQPIVQLRTGRCHGFEALVRGWQAFGLSHPADLFDAAYADGLLGPLEDALMRKAAGTFATIRAGTEGKLFLNVDARLRGAAELVASIARDQPFQVVHEISERDSTAVGERLQAAVELYRRNGVGIALDDFGVGHGGLRLLHESTPEYVKIDRYFISGIDCDLRKRAIVGSLVHYAHALGIAIVAEGIETGPEFYVCRDLGCDFAQGFLLARAEEFANGLPAVNPVAERLNREDRRAGSGVRERLAELLERIEPFSIDMPKSRLLDIFARPDAPAVLPVIGRDRAPKGIIREHDLRPFVYSHYGRELLLNRATGHRLTDLIVPCAVCDISTPIERVVEAVSTDQAADGVIIVEGAEYVGFLSGHALLRLVHEQRLAAAADQNPLTRLPGNEAIMRHLSRLATMTERPRAVVYLDFDNFKPFNDVFGFRQGDRAILMFSERLKFLANSIGGFAGHIGGDDFVLMLDGLDRPVLQERLLTLLEQFRQDVESLYTPAEREARCFRAKDRSGNERDFPLMTASAVAVMLPPGMTALDRLEDLVRRMAEAKSRAKSEPAHIWFVDN